MTELYNVKTFLEVYERIIFKSRQFIKSKKFDGRIHFSNPFEKSIILIENRADNEVEESKTEQPIVIANDDEFEEYDKYSDDISQENPKEIETQSNETKTPPMFSRLLRISIDNKNTWQPLEKDLALENASNGESYVTDIFNSYCLKLSPISIIHLLIKLFDIEKKYEYIIDCDLTEKYYSPSNSNTLNGIKLNYDSFGNVISEEKVRFDNVDFYGKKFTEIFPEDNRRIAEKNPRTEQHRNYLFEHSDELNINIFGKNFIAKNHEDEIANFSALSLLSENFVNRYEALKLWKEEISKINITPESFETPQKYIDEFEKVFGVYYPMLEDEFQRAFQDYKDTITDKELLNTYEAAEELLDNFYDRVDGEGFLFQFSEKLFIRFYLNSLFNDMLKYAEERKKYQENTENFNGSFIGGGFTKKGVLKGILNASVANFAEDLLNQANQYGDIEHKYVKKALQELGITELSKKYLLELIEIDIKFTMILVPFFANEKINQLYSDLNCESFNELNPQMVFDYLEAHQYYSVYIAKKMSLDYIPQYENDNGILLSKFSNLELLQNAICLFPYERKFYKSYIDECGEQLLPLGFSKLMKMFDVDDERFEDIEKKENEEYEKLENERIAREIWEENKRKKEKEEQQKQKEEKQKRYDELISIYGDTYYKHELAFNCALENEVFLNHFKRTFESTKQLMDSVNEYIKGKEMIIGKLFTNTSPRFNTILQKAKSSYVYETLNDTDVLMVFDATVFGNAKNGFIISKNAIYLKGLLTDATKVKYEDIEVMTVGLDGVSVGKKDFSCVYGLPGSVGEIGKIVSSVILNQIYIYENEK